MINIKLTETEYQRIMSALTTVNDDPCRNVGDLIESLKKSHDRYVRAQELSSARFLVQQAYNKCKDVTNSTSFVCKEELRELSRVVDSLQNAMNEIDHALLFYKSYSFLHTSEWQQL